MSEKKRLKSGDYFGLILAVDYMGEGNCGFVKDKKSCVRYTSLASLTMHSSGDVLEHDLTPKFLFLKMSRIIRRISLCRVQCRYTRVKILSSINSKQLVWCRQY